MAEFRERTRKQEEPGRKLEGIVPVVAVKPSELNVRIASTAFFRDVGDRLNEMGGERVRGDQRDMQTLPKEQPSVYALANGMREALKNLS